MQVKEGLRRKISYQNEVKYKAITCRITDSKQSQFGAGVLRRFERSSRLCIITSSYLIPTSLEALCATFEFSRDQIVSERSSLVFL